ncbi:MAG: ThuA domain-containing protein [Clostridia bacterium]|nr:ThuA domain-containing protein [Clostridia bacterium]
MIRVTIWNEYAGDQKEDYSQKIYPGGIHAVLKEKLADDDFEITTAYFEQDERHGLSDELLDNTDVLIWWGHCLHDEVNPAVVDKVCERVLDGMGFIPLHSAHRSLPFRRLLGTSCHLTWREFSGENVHIWTVDPSHPIAEGVPLHFMLDEEEMYGEYFDIPTPDEIVFISWFKGGNVFRGGITFTRRLGKIFYFHPGHETIRSYHNENVIQVIKNAIRWAAPKFKKPLPELAEWQDPLEPMVSTYNPDEH